MPIDLLRSSKLNNSNNIHTKNQSNIHYYSGNTFVNKAAAVQRACDIQMNGCADAVNGGKASGVTVSDCQAQQQTCISSAS